MSRAAREQHECITVPLASIAGSRAFRDGYREVFDGVPFDYERVDAPDAERVDAPATEYDQHPWNYERGRAFAVCDMARRVRTGFIPGTWAGGVFFVDRDILVRLRLDFSSGSIL